MAYRRKKRADLKTTNRSLFDRVERNNGKLATQQGIITKHKLRIAELESQIQPLNLVLSSLHGAMSDLQETNSKLENERMLATDQLSQAEKSVAQLKEKHQVSG